MGKRISRGRLDEMVREHLPSLLRFAVRLTGSLHDGEDAAQESLLRISKAWKRLRDEESFKSWAFQILVNTVRDQRRRHKAEIETTVATGPDGEGDLIQTAASDIPTPEEISQLVELREEIETKLLQLPPRQREVLALLAFEPYSPQDVAKMLDIDVGNVYANLRVARSKLQKILVDSDESNR